MSDARDHPQCNTWLAREEVECREQDDESSFNERETAEVECSVLALQSKPVKVMISEAGSD